MPVPHRTRLPLEGVRVADLTLVLAGPFATMLLADWGAEVIRIEPLQNRQPSTRGRYLRPTAEHIIAEKHWGNAYPNWEPGRRPWNRWPAFQAHGRNKLAMTVDFNQREGIEIIQRIVAVSDIAIENNAPDTVDKLGFGYEVLRRVKPDLVMVRMPAYGLTGPHRNYRSLGAHLEGTAGHTHIRGYPDTDPTATEDVYFGDAAASLGAAYAAVLSLHEARRTGRGQLIEFAQVENLVPFFGELFLDYQMNGRIATRGGNDYYDWAPHNTYPTAGRDRWIAIAVGSEEHWRGLVQAMNSSAGPSKDSGFASLAGDPRFVTRQSRFQHRRELDEIVARWTSQRLGRWLMELLQRHGVPAGVVNDDHDACEDRHLAARGFFETLEHRDCGVHRYPGLVWKLARTPNAIRLPPPCLGEHNPCAYRELLGIAEAEYRRLEAAGHIGEEYPPHVQWSGARRAASLPKTLLVTHVPGLFVTHVPGWNPQNPSPSEPVLSQNRERRSEPSAASPESAKGQADAEGGEGRERVIPPLANSLHPSQAGTWAPLGR